MLLFLILGRRGANFLENPFKLDYTLANLLQRPVYFD